MRSINTELAALDSLRKPSRALMSMREEEDDVAHDVEVVVGESGKRSDPPIVARLVSSHAFKRSFNVPLTHTHAPRSPRVTRISHAAVHRGVGDAQTLSRAVHSDLLYHLVFLPTLLS